VKGEKLGASVLVFFPKGRGVCFVFFFKDQRGGYDFFARDDRVRVFFCVFLNCVKLPPCKFSAPCVYGWRFTYIENLYTCYLRKYCNNYCRDCLL
jgi:hypothetical protein